MVWVVRLSLGLSTKACKQNTDRTIKARAVKLGTHACYDKRTTPIVFQRSRSLWCVYTQKLVNKTQKEPLGLGPSTLVHILMTRGRHLLFFKVRGQRSTSLGCICTQKLVNNIQTESFRLGVSNLVHILVMTRGHTVCQGQRSRPLVCLYTKVCKQDNPRPRFVTLEPILVIDSITLRHNRGKLALG